VEIWTENGGDLKGKKGANKIG